MKALGINYKLNKNATIKSGVLPSLDIVAVEKLIHELELIVEENPEMESVNNLMDLYQKV